MTVNLPRLHAGPVQEHLLAALSPALADPT